MPTARQATLTARQQAILQAVVVEHVRSAAPVGSQDLVENYDFGVSPATIRNEMLTLEEAGLLEQPHTSAGRVPTELGYRTYVQSSLQGATGLEQRRSQMERRLVRIQQHYEALARETALLLAEMTEQGAIASTGAQAERAGLSNLISLPELQDNEIARAVARAFDHPEEVLAHVSRPRSKPALQVSVPGGAPVRVYIGADAGLGRLPLAVLVSAFPHGSNGRKRGHLIVIGPARMAYNRNVATLSYLSGLLARHVRSSGKYLTLVALILPAGLIIHQINNLSL